MGDVLGSDPGGRRAGRPAAVRRRADQLHQKERRLLREWERDRRRFVAADRRLQHHAAVWEARIHKAMRWPDPTAWWRTNRRVESGERWIGHDAEARWRQRVVYVTRDRVLELDARRDAALAQLRAARGEAGQALQATTRRLVAAAGSQQVLVVLGVPSSVLLELVGGKSISVETAAVLGEASGSSRALSWSGSVGGPDGRTGAAGENLPRPGLIRRHGRPSGAAERAPLVPEFRS